MSGPGYISSEPEGVCKLCGKKAELRPYGRGGENVCFDCGMLDEQAAIRAFELRTFGEYKP